MQKQKRALCSFLFYPFPFILRIRKHSAVAMREAVIDSDRRKVVQSGYKVAGIHAELLEKQRNRRANYAGYRHDKGKCRAYAAGYAKGRPT